MRGRREEAVGEYRRRIEIDPESTTCTPISGVPSNLGRNAEAPEATGHAIELDGDNDDGHSDRAVILSAVDRAEEAVKNAKVAIRINPENPRAHLNHGMASLYLGATRGIVHKHSSYSGVQIVRKVDDF